MTITLNGKKLDFECPINITDLLQSQGIKADRVAVEVNYEIILKQEWNTFLIQENDQIEVIRFVGGG